MAAVVVLAALALVYIFRPKVDQGTTGKRREIVISEAVRTLLYLPLYYAEHNRIFELQGLSVTVQTAGTATNSFAALVSGQADFSQADPMYVPISHEKGASNVVVAQVVGRIAVWGVTNSLEIESLNPGALQGKRISTHPRPMTAYTYAAKFVRDMGLSPDEVEIIQSKPGTELAPLWNNQADLAFTLEPGTSRAEAQGARVVYSFPEALGDQVFTGLMTTQAFLDKEPEVVRAVVRSYQIALSEMAADPTSAIDTAAAYFPDDREILAVAVHRLIREQVFPPNVLISEDSWNRAIEARIAAGDLQSSHSRDESCAVSLMKEVAGESDMLLRKAS